MNLSLAFASWFDVFRLNFQRFYCFVVFIYGLGQIIEIKIKRAGISLLCPKLGIKSVFNHVVDHVIILDGQ